MPIYKGSFSVFPVYAGVILKKANKSIKTISVPRVCGGDPMIVIPQLVNFRCSPCMRGYYGFIMITIWNINEVYGLNISFLIILLRS